MSVFASIGIIILSMLILTLMQLPSGVFALFYHYASGKYSKKHTSSLSIFYFLGVEVITTCLFISCTYFAFIFSLIDTSNNHHFLIWIAGIIFILLACASFFYYFRNGKNSKTFIPRSIADALDYSARNIKTRSDAFMLGAFSGTCELIFTLPLYITVGTLSSFAINLQPSLITIIPFFILAPLIPLFFYYSLYHHNRNLADILKFRFKNKSFTRVILSISYLFIALIIFSGF